ncbi:MAG: pyridoxamine 5'-phosphate oxidase family protein [Phaeodactylibacter sp.]|nr:pyridoxamine 5'-phosphate oxidase family protein [Phaeodactylibacter sp.]HQU60384.1 pyridoxamine 5'-phosphate oxidase family protein [Saprospiraceae bacterium]
MATRDYLQQPPNQIRRKDRAMEDETWIRAFLAKAPFGAFAFSHDGQPFINSNIFVYDPTRHAIYFHTASEGRTRSILEQNPSACFSISEMGRLLPADTALEMSVEYLGVTAFGKVQVVEAREEAFAALQLLLDKYFPHLRPGQDYRPTTPEEWKRTAVFRLDIELWSGKQKKADAEFPGAFLYGAVHQGASSGKVKG